MDDEDELPAGDGSAEDSAEVECPYCGEASEIAVDPGGGSPQEYVEDCPVCCRPWNVTVTFTADGSASISVTAADEEG